MINDPDDNRKLPDEIINIDGRSYGLDDVSFSDEAGSVPAVIISDMQTGDQFTLFHMSMDIHTGEVRKLAIFKIVGDDMEALPTPANKFPPEVRNILAERYAATLVPEGMTISQELLQTLRDGKANMSVHPVETLKEKADREIEATDFDLELAGIMAEDRTGVIAAEWMAASEKEREGLLKQHETAQEQQPELNRAVAILADKGHPEHDAFKAKYKAIIEAHEQKEPEYLARLKQSRDNKEQGPER